MAPTNKKAAPAKQVNAPARQAAPVDQAQPKAIERVTSSPIASMTNAAPAWLKRHMSGEAPRGLDKMDQADMILPRLVLAQALSPEVTADGSDIRVGDIFDNLTKQVLTRAGQELHIIPVVLGKTRMHLQPFNDGGGILCRADDALTARPGGDGQDEGGNPTRDCSKCIRKEWDDETGKPECSLFYNLVVLLPEFNMAAYVFSGKHTNVKVFKRLLSSMKQTGVDAFALKFGIKSVTEQSSQFTYKNFDFKPMGYVSEHEYVRGLAFYKSLEGKTWTPDTSDIADDVAAEQGETVEHDTAPVVVAEPGADADEEIPF